jgi:N-methylhydantoinase B
MAVTLDPVTLEVLRNALLGTAAEMKAVVQRSSYSSLWSEAGDLSCGVLTPRGEIVAQGPDDIPVHLACMPLSLRGCLDRIPVASLEPGDVLLQNDPYQGNNHLPDLFMAMPVFVGDTLLAFTAVRGHHADIGGMGPGSYSAITSDIHAEGLRIPPLKLYRRGVLNDDVLDVLAANVRGAVERRGDVFAQHAGCLNGQRSLCRLADRYGVEVLTEAMDAILDHSEALMRGQLAAVPNGRYEANDFCDVQGDLIRLEVAVTIADDTVVVDFGGTDPEGIHGMNAPFPVTASATYYALKALVDPSTPANDGCYRPIDVRAPLGSVLNCRYPRSVVLANHETATRIVDVITRALAVPLPERVVAAGNGTSGPIVLAGRDDRPGREGAQFLWLEVGGAGQGASVHGDGVAGMRVGVGNTGNTPTEDIEYKAPVLTEFYGFVQDTGGPGKHRGACALRRTFLVEADEAVLTMSFEREFVPPFGLFGGEPGAKAALSMEREGVVTPLPSKTAPTVVRRGDRITAQCAGSGGWVTRAAATRRRC